MASPKGSSVTLALFRSSKVLRLWRPATLRYVADLLEPRSDEFDLGEGVGCVFGGVLALR